jgi:hypothetical protein
VIGAVGADALAEELSGLISDRPANGRPVLARRLHAGASLAHCFS